MGVQAHALGLAAAALALHPLVDAAEALPQVEVVAVTPVAGSGLPLAEVPSAVQRFGERELARRSGLGLAELLEAEAIGLGSHAAQGNRHQPDIRFRGFSASPLLGQAQGLSVYLDGVRINEPFGDVVNWDLVPTAALASVQILPGSNPLFGRNTLGGALVLQTKNGHEHPGLEAEAAAGSQRRRDVQLSHGGAHGAWDHFATVQLEDDGGAREHSGSRLRQGFARVGHRDGRGDTHATLQWAANRLEGAQTLPLSWMDQPRQAYTWPDLTRNRLGALALGFSRSPAPGMELAGKAWLRRLHSTNLSSNVAADDPTDPPATNELATIRQSVRGASLQLTADRRAEGVGHRWVVGAALDQSGTRYTQRSQPADFTADRGTVGTADFATATDARVDTRALGVYAMDTWALSPQWTLTASARHDATWVRIEDRTGLDPALDGHHRFARLNPALGVNFRPAPRWNLFAGLSDGFRAPTAMELTCADPAAPCKLPTSFVSDPPLKPVVARTLELGARHQGPGWQWSATLFRGTLRDDIQFIASQGSTLQGYFQNVGRTRRQGLELAGQARQGSLAFSARYAWLDARFLDGFAERSPWNSTADANGLVQVPGGARMPGTPRHQLKLRVEWRAAPGWTLGLDGVAASASLSRGDENNAAAGSRVPGWALFHLDATWQAAPGLELFGRVHNVFDRRSQSFGVLGRNAFTGPGRAFDPANAQAEPFRGPGAPLRIWVGLRWTGG